jgi:polyhydroxyalkanoate synthase subunit PhaC
MTTNEYDAPVKSEKFLENMARIEQLTQRLTAAFTRKAAHDPALDAPDPDIFLRTATAFMNEAAHNPAKLVEQQVQWWGKTLTHYVEAQQVLAQGKLAAPADPGPKDRRFSNPLWDSHPYFNFLKQQYLVNSEAIQQAVSAIDGLDANDKRRIEYFSKQIIDMMAPMNFFGMNPDALEKAVETEGESLVRGLENLVRDLEANDGELIVTLSDPEAFKVGQNIGATPGQVVFRNRILELIQFTPTTETVHKTPLIIFPPWINKFYILDLKPQNSLIKWIVDQGFTLFVVSWKNPDETYADFGMDDYIREGYHEAFRVAKEITGEKQVNAVGYCIAGTTLSLALARMARDGDSSVKSATYFTMLSDFSDQGEFAPFLTDDFIGGIEREVADKGFLSNKIMSRTFSFLRSNDLIYQPAIRSYMLGEAPPAFDLLFWNGDGTNLPAKMSVEYLRGLCQRNEFADGGFPVFGDKVTLKDIKVPVCAIGCETDHIAAWKTSYTGIKQFGSKDKTFIVSESGHIAGIVNPPGKDKYGHYTNDATMTTPEEFMAGATYHKGSWWPRWGEWLGNRSGAMVAARVPGAHPSYPALCPAPGTYVLRQTEG